MTVYAQKDVVLVNFPFTDLTSSKQRPAIIVSNSKVNNTGDLTVVMLTTQPVPEEFCIEIGNVDVDTPFKFYESMNVHCKKIAVLDKRIVYKKISSVTNVAKFKAILDKIKSNFDYDN